MCADGRPCPELVEIGKTVARIDERTLSIQQRLSAGDAHFSEDTELLGAIGNRVGKCEGGVRRNDFRWKVAGWLLATAIAILGVAGTLVALLRKAVLPSLFTVHCLLFTVLCAGCLSPTEPIRQNAGALRDMTARMNREGVAPHAPVAAQAAACARTNEEILGPPQVRLPVDDASLPAVETARRQAQADAQAGGFWIVAAGGAISVLSALGLVVGCPAAANWLAGLLPKIKEVRARAAAAEAEARAAAEKLTTVSSAFGALSRAADGPPGGEAPADLREAIVAEIRETEGLTLDQVRELHQLAQSKAI